MGLAHSPRIVTNGLVGYWDAANRKSYPGSGTVWNDLSGNGNNGTLTNGPTFSDANSGSLVFDGADDRINFPFSSVFDISGSITLEAFIYPTAYNSGVNNGGILVAKVGSYYFELKSNGKLRAYFYSLSSEGYHDSTNVVPLNTWTHGIVTRDAAASTINFYINGSLDRTLSSITGNIAVQQNYFLTAGDWTGGGYTHTGRISNIKIYNRALSAAEISQNYNALRGRFGL